MEDHGPSRVYVGMKERACKETGITSIKYLLPKDITQNDLIEKVKAANKDPNIDAIIVQMPLPEHIDSNSVILAIDPMKDVDGFHPINCGKMMMGLEGVMLACTPHGVCKILEISEFLFHLFRVESIS